MTFIFDTNVLSEVMRDIPDASVAEWLRSCPSDQMHTTSISRAEILYGIRKLPLSARRARLQAAADRLFDQTFADRILAFDAKAASTHADIRVQRQRSGRPIATEDSMIAAIAVACEMTVVTRDLRGFSDCGVPVINPWMSG